MAHEVDQNKIIGTEIKPGDSYTIYSCGRERSPSGTEGTITMSDKKENGSRIADIYWDCPWGVGKNQLEQRSCHRDWLVSVLRVQPFGEIGHVTVEFGSLMSGMK